MSDTKKHKISSKFRIGAIGIGEVPFSVRNFWNRKNFDKGEFLALRAKKKEQIIDKEFNNELINLKIMSTRKVQVLKCKCGAKYAACSEPYCYEDTDWLKDLRKCLKEGGTVEMESAEEFRFTSCTCEDEPTLFS